jgi:uncharacterized protein YjbJ (UPF0337 family)
MEWHQIEDNWSFFKKKARDSWDRISKEELNATAGKREQLVALLEEHYDLDATAAREEVERWRDSIGGPPSIH